MENPEKQNVKQKQYLPTEMYKWQRICIYVIAILTLLAILSNDGGIIDLFIGVLINSAILYFAFKFGNKIYKKFKK